MSDISPELAAELDRKADELVATFPPFTPAQEEVVRRIFAAFAEQDRSAA